MDNTEHIILTDEDQEGKLKNYCYTNCDNNTDTDIQRCRGLVYKDDKPFLKSFGYTPIFTKDTVPMTLRDVSTFRFFESFEGTLLRLFYNDINSKWYLSTHKKLDAQNSFWGNTETFGERFNKFIKKEEYNKLNKDLSYMFIITPTPSNRIVCVENLNRVIHVGTYDQKFSLSFDYDINIARPAEFIFQTFSELQECVDNTNYKHLQGILMCDPIQHVNYKIMNDTYKRYYDIRDNSPSVKFRYLQLRGDPEKKSVLQEMYPNFCEEFQNYEGLLLKSCRFILVNYIKRFVNKEYVKISPEEYKVMKECHTWHLLDKTKNIVTVNIIIQQMNKQTPVHLNRIIKIYKNK
jgi:hypothetical protein